MTEPNANTGMVQQLSRKLIPLAMGIALLVAVLAPATYWILEHRELQRLAVIYAEDLAHKLQQLALESPTLWKYQTHKFIAITEQLHHTIEVSDFRILDDQGELIAGHDYHQSSGESPERLLPFTKALPFILGTAPIIFNDRQVGTVEVLVDDTTIVQTSIRLFLFWSLIGTGLALLVYRFPLRVARKMSGEIEGLISTVQQSEARLRRLNEELAHKVEERTRQLLEIQEELVRKEKLAILGQLSGSVGHELRNPLGVMSNAIYFLKMVLTEADETVQEYLGIIESEIDNSLRIITDLLDFARTRPPQTKPVMVRELTDASLGRCAIPENIDLQTEIPDNLPLLRVDPLQMRQVLINFINNAIQAMPEGGALRIAARSAGAIHESPLQHPMRETGDFIAISVADTGEGITPENLKRLFQPLFTTKARGIGLGLVVCQNLAEANGGRIEVESAPGQGTSFTLQLPVAEGEG